MVQRNVLEYSATGHELSFRMPSITAVYIVSSCYKILVEASPATRVADTTVCNVATYQHVFAPSCRRFLI